MTACQMYEPDNCFGKYKSRAICGDCAVRASCIRESNEQKHMCEARIIKRRCKGKYLDGRRCRIQTASETGLCVVHQKRQVKESESVNNNTSV
jgi:hypothetical protein